MKNAQKTFKNCLVLYNEKYLNRIILKKIKIQKVI